MAAQADNSAPRRLALLIATSDYNDPALRQLRAPGRDASDLAEVLGIPQIGGFIVQTLINARYGELLEAIEEFCADRRPDDQLLIYMSCHGVLDDRGRLYYAATDTRRQRTAATAVAAAWLNERLEDCRARSQIVILDCCHSGAFAKGLKGQADLALEQRFKPHGRGRIVLTASRGTEYSFEGDQLSGEGVRSVFTQAIVDGLRTGDADRDKDGLITVTDIYHYVYERVRAVEPRQTPELWTYGAEGKVLLAYSVRGAIIEPVPLPEDLYFMLQSPRPRVRETAVAELAELLDAARPGLALSARHALRQISDEDIPRVAVIARMALEASTGTAAREVSRELADRDQRERGRHEAREAARRQAEEQAQREVRSAVGQQAETLGRQDAVRGKAESPSQPGSDLTSAPEPGSGREIPRASSSPRARGAIPRRLLIVASAGIAAIGVLAVVFFVFVTHHPSGASNTSATAKVRWSRSTGGAVVQSSPAVAEGIVYLGSDDGKVYALDAATGHFRWSRTAGSLVDSSPAVAGGVVYVGSGLDNEMYALDAATGHLRWSYPTGGTVDARPALAGGVVYVGSDDGKVYALDAATGQFHWSYDTGNAVEPKPTVADGVVYVGGNDGKVYALDAATGHFRWSYPTRNTVNSSPTVAGGVVYVGSDDGKVYALDAATGHFRWSYPTGGPVDSTPAVTGGVVYVDSLDGKTYALDTATGHFRWSYPTGNTVNGAPSGFVNTYESSPVVAGGTVYIGSDDGKLYALDAATGHSRWSYLTGGPVESSPVVAGGTVYIGSDDGKVYALDAAGSGVS